MKKIKINYNLVAEFLFSMMRVFDQKDRFENGKVLVIHNREIEKYCQRVRVQIDPDIKTEFRKFVNGFTGGMLALVDYAVASRIESVTAFLECMDNLTSLELVDLYLKEYHITELTSSSPKKDIIQQVREKVESRVVTKESKLIRLFLKDEELKEQMLSYFTYYYDNFFKELEEELIHRLDETKRRHEQLIVAEEEKFIDHILPFVRNESIPLTSLNLHVSYTGEISNMLWRYENEEEVRYIYGVAHEQKMDNEYTNIIRKEFLKLLQDDTRYSIIKLLGEKKWYGKELADHFGLTTATMSYHLNRLTNFGVVDIEKGVNKRYYYSLNKSALKKLYMRVLDDVLGGENNEMDG